MPASMTDEDEEFPRPSQADSNEPLGPGGGPASTVGRDLLAVGALTVVDRYSSPLMHCKTFSNTIRASASRAAATSRRQA